MTRTNAQLTIVFADISGSTRLYETLGNAVARQIVSQCLELMTEQIETFDGEVIKTIGDEIMCTYPSADSAMESCKEMLMTIADDVRSLNPRTPRSLKLRIGLHTGPVILENGDVFGDAVNIAARMVELAKGDQIITTQETVSNLKPGLRADTRRIDSLSVKGKSQPIDIFEYMLQPDNATVLVPDHVFAPSRTVRLKLTYRGSVIELEHDGDSATIGRGRRADLAVTEQMASREHAVIECKRDRFLITDKSVNGTYVDTPNGVVYLRREQIDLTGRGKISLGRAHNEASEFVHFSCG